MCAAISKSVVAVDVATLRSFARSFGFTDVSKLKKVELLKLLKFPHDEVEALSPKKKAKSAKKTKDIKTELTVADYRSFARSFGFTDVSKMKKADLMDLLCIPKEQPSQIAHLTVAELREFAESFGFSSLKKLTRKELIELLKIPEFETPVATKPVAPKKLPDLKDAGAVLADERVKMVRKLKTFLRNYETDLTIKEVNKIDAWIKKAKAATTQETINTIARSLSKLSDSVNQE